MSMSLTHSKPHLDQALSLFSVCNLTNLSPLLADAIGNARGPISTLLFEPVGTGAWFWDARLSAVWKDREKDRSSIDNTLLPARSRWFLIRWAC